MARAKGRPGSKTIEELKPDAEIDAIGDARARYNAQVNIVNKLRHEWERLGSPMTQPGGANGKTMVVHSLVKEIQDAEVLADRFLQRVLEKRKVGRPAGSATAPDRQPADGNGVPKQPARIRKIA